MSCKKSTDGPLPTATAVVYPKGTSIAQPLSAQIGPGGGTFSSADGLLDIVVPAGAVSQTTEFSIEPISNTLPASEGNAFRVDAGGVTLSTPAIVTIHYDQLNLENTALRFLYIAYQDENGYWHMMNNTTINKTAKTISAETTHFSDWAVLHGVQMVATIDPTTNKTAMILMNMEFADSAKLGKYLPVEHNQSAQWNVITGSGTLETSSDGSESTFTPTPNVPGPATVEVSLENLPDHLDQPDRRDEEAKIRHFIASTTEPLEEEYVDFTVTGSGGPSTVRCKGGGATAMGIMIQGSAGTPGNLTSSIYINIDATSASDGDHFVFGPPTATGATFIRCMPVNNGKLFESNYYETITCDPDDFDLKYTDGEVNITHWANASSKYMTGSFTAHLKAKTSDPQACPKVYETVSINGTFKVKMR